MSISEEAYNEGKVSRNSEIFNEQYELYESPSNNDNQSTQNGRTSNRITQLDRKTKTDELVSYESKSKTNSEELDNSSFLMTINLN